MTTNITGIVLTVVTIIALCKVLNKAGEPFWKGIIPIYNKYCLYNTVGRGIDYVKTMVLSFAAIGIGYIGILSDNKFLIVLTVIASLILIGYVLYIAYSVMSDISSAFGYSTGFAIGLFLLNDVFLIILGFDNSEFRGKENDSIS